MRAGGVAHDDVGDGEVDGGARADLGGSAVEDEDARGGGDEPALLPTAEVVDPDVDVALRGRGVVGVGGGAQPAGVEAAVAALAPGGRDAVVVHVRAGNAGRGRGSVVGKAGGAAAVTQGKGKRLACRAENLTTDPFDLRPRASQAGGDLRHRRAAAGGVQPIRGVRAGEEDAIATRRDGRRDARWRHNVTLGRDACAPRRAERSSGMFRPCRRPAR